MRHGAWGMGHGACSSRPHALCPAPLYCVFALGAHLTEPACAASITWTISSSDDAPRSLSYQAIFPSKSVPFFINSLRLDGRSIQQPRSLNSESSRMNVGVAARPSGVRCASWTALPTDGLINRISTDGTLSSRLATYGTMFTESLQPGTVTTSSFHPDPAAAARVTSASGATPFA